MTFEITVLLLLAILAYAWVGYPVLLKFSVRLRRGSPPRNLCRRPRAGCIQDQTVVVLFAAYNEEANILARLENLKATGSPLPVEIHVGIDAGTDRTAEIAREFAVRNANVFVHEFKQRRGKAAVLKDLVEKAGGRSWNVESRTCDVGNGGKKDESLLTSPASPATSNEQRTTSNCILVFTDANTSFEENALERLLEPFNTPEVGGVCGRLIFVAHEERVTGCVTTNHEQQTTNPDIARVPRNARPKGRDVAAMPPQTGSATFVSSNIQFDKTSRAPAQGLESIGAVPEPLIAGVVADSCNERANNHPTPTEEGFYWRWETGLKTAESALDSCLGANGAIYAIRANLFPVDIPNNTIIDDFVIGMKVRESGYRMVYEPAAVAYEETAPGVGNEWTRRVRIGAGDFQSLMLCRRCLLPQYGTFAWMFWSHKVLRWFTPHLILLVVALGIAGTMCANARTFPWILSVSVLGAFSLFLVVATIGRFLRGSRGSLMAFFRLCDYFLVMQLALFAGFLRFCRGGLSGAWERTARGEKV